MSIKEQLRSTAIRNRQQDKLRSESVLTRAAQQIGVDANEVIERNWQAHSC